MSLLYGFSLLYIISALMGYNLSRLYIAIISLITYIYSLIIYRSKKIFVIYSMLLTIVTGISFYYLFKVGKLDSLIHKSITFIKEYHQVLTIETVDVGFNHQLFLIAIISICSMPILIHIIFKLRNHRIIIYGINLIVIISGILTESLDSNYAKSAYILFISTMFIYYFYNFYQQKGSKYKGFKFFILISLFSIFVSFSISKVLYLLNPEPFKTTLFSIKTVIGSGDLDKPKLLESNIFSYKNVNAVTIQKKVIPENIELFETDALYTRYFKADVFEYYKGGKWSKINNLKTDLVDLKYYMLEDVKVVYNNILTNLYFSNSYGVLEIEDSNGIPILFEQSRGIYYGNDVLKKQTSFSFTSILPTYGTTNFNSLLRESSKKDISGSLDEYKNIIADKRVVVLAKVITKDIDNQFDKLSAIEHYLENNYLYNRTPDFNSIESDPVLDFLFNNKEGFCQQFASAFILLARSLDIPSRYVTGFYIEQETDSDMDLDISTSTVYDNDAHSWPEVYFSGVGWIIFDPTPGKDNLSGRDIPIVENENLIKKDIERTPSDLEKSSIHYKIIFLTMISLLLTVSLVLVRFWIKKLRSIKALSNEKKLLIIIKVIKYYYNFTDTNIDANETLRAYAKRISSYEPLESTIKMVDLIPDIERVLYGNQQLSNTDLIRFIDYLYVTRMNIKNRVKPREYVKKIFVEYFIFIRIS